MRELVLPRPVDIAAFFLAALLVAGVASATYYVTNLQHGYTQLQARVGALENRPAEQVTVSPSPSPTDSPEPSAPESPNNSVPDGTVVAAASGGSQPGAGRSPQRQPSTGGSPSSPGTPPPAAAPPSADEPDDDCSARLLALCVRAELLSSE